MFQFICNKLWSKQAANLFSAFAYDIIYAFIEGLDAKISVYTLKNTKVPKAACCPDFMVAPQTQTQIHAYLDQDTRVFISLSRHINLQLQNPNRDGF